jgi:hypothetical protein
VIYIFPFFNFIPALRLNMFQTTIVTKATFRRSRYT